jgi:hypothetical protein
VGEHGVKFENDDLREAFAWAHTVAVERALSDPPEASVFCRMLKAYDGYRIPFLLGTSQQGGELAMAPLRVAFGPDGAQRYATVFTAGDHLDRWTATGTDDLVAVNNYDGATAFALLRDSGLDGIVFNPNLARPPAFRIDVCQYILEGGCAVEGS